ncbi:hypothetical protein ACH5RR_036037 [Cinchona calisaya]|uniref:PGG domain-containing protein n=1 Tax=Cinchona calisaya TaxID=153742 RepID=A0ABD2Y7K0_9GENT
MTQPSKNSTLFVSDAKDHIGAAAAAAAVEYSTTPKESSSLNSAGADDEAEAVVKEAAAASGTTGEHVVLAVWELLRSLDEDVQLAILVHGIDGTGDRKISIARRRLQQEMITSNHNTSELINQIALQFCAQLSAVFMGFALNKSLPSCSCAVSASAKWIAITVTFTFLTGFVLSLIALAMSLLENKNSTPPGGPGSLPPSKRRSIFSAAAEFGFAGLVSTVIISMGATLPLNTISMVAVTAGAIFLPLFIAFLHVLDHLKLLFDSCLNGFAKYFMQG